MPLPRLYPLAVSICSARPSAFPASIFFSSKQLLPGSPLCSSSPLRPERKFSFTALGNKSARWEALKQSAGGFWARKEGGEAGASQASLPAASTLAERAVAQRKKATRALPKQLEEAAWKPEQEALPA